MMPTSFCHQQHQQGSTIIMVLIVMTVLLFSSMVMFRSVDTTAMIAGNIATKTASTNIGDIGARQAIAALSAITNLEAPTSVYFPVQQPVDNAGLPTTVDWTGIPSQTIQNYTIQFVVERLCNGSLPIANPDSQCTNITTTVGGSKKTTSPTIGKKTFYYRGTVRITGGKQANSYVQVMLVQ